MREAVIRILLGAVGFAILYLFILPAGTQIDAAHALLYGLAYSITVAILAKVLAKKY